jgi:glycosyltransferase involved in cell wall biosynthesis
MKIAMILRPDADRTFGGDTVVMNKLCRALTAAGAGAVVGKLEEMPPPREFDLLHIFTVAPIDHAQRMVAWAKRGGIAIVFSPLYHASFRHQFEKAIATVSYWRTLSRVLGRRPAWAVYQAWMEAKLPLLPVWQASRAALHAATCIAAGSRWENRYIAHHFRLSPEARRRMRVSPLGIDAALYGRVFSDTELTAFRERYALEPGYVAEAARLEPKKNQLAVIEALLDDPVPLVFVGQQTPECPPGYAARCHELGARRGKTHFLGWLPEDELPLLYAAAAAHILPSWVELPGLSSLEAGACGCRVISTAISPLKEMLGEQAWYVDPFDRAAIRDTVRAALAAPVDPGLRPRLLAEFNWERAAAADLELYKGALQIH